MKRTLLLCSLLLPLILPVHPATAGGEDGGTGLLDIDQAFSLAVARPVFKLHGGYYSNDFTSGSSRLLTLTPSLTWGLGGGFEAAAALPLEAVTSDLEGEEFDRRFDFRRSDPRAKFRWTGNFAGTRLRAGAQAHARLGLGSSSRPGGTEDLDIGIDPGIDLLLSSNVGHFSFPLRIHANAGYWLSRDDGSAWYRHHPFGFPLPSGVEGNDVFSAGLAVEAGFRRAVVFAELLTEQLVEARGAVSSQENLWRFTPGVRTALTSTVELTAAVSFDLSEDDAATAFDPGSFFPDYELRAGISLGSVLSRERYEARKRAEAQERREAGAQATQLPFAPSPAEAGAVDVAEPTPPPAPPLATEAERLAELEQRLRQLEVETRLGLLEARLRIVEQGGWALPPASVGAPDSNTASAATSAVISPRELSLRAQLSAMQRELMLQQAAAGEATDQPVPPTSRETELAAQVRALQEQLEARREATSGPAPAEAGAAVDAPPSRGGAAGGRSAVVTVPATRSPNPPASEPPAPVTSPPAAPESTPAEPVAPPARSPEEGFPLAPGEQREIEGLSLGPTAAPLQGSDTDLLDDWALHLANHPGVQLAIVVYADEADAAQALQRSEAQARAVRDYLVVAGASPAQLVPLGMGQPRAGEASGPGLRFERTDAGGNP